MTVNNYNYTISSTLMKQSQLLVDVYMNSNEENKKRIRENYKTILGNKSIVIW